jgi:hypothetical protein
MQHHIFLSYTQKDLDIMGRVRASLLAADLTVRTADDANGTNDIESLIQNAGCCVVILSPEANGNESIDDQLELARLSNLKIFPVIGRGDEWSAIPKAFIGTQMIDVRANHDARMDRLIGLIKTHLGIQT